MGDPVEEEVQISVPHVAQSSHWDCGLACARMILKHFGMSLEDFENVAKKGGFGESVWTIDLVQLLHEYKVACRMTTIMLGVDKEYSKKSFYRSRFATDQQRVDDLFRQAPSRGLTVEQRSVSAEELMRHLAVERQPLIVLIDCNLLSCLQCNSLVVDMTCNCFGQCISRTGAYQGHFIVVCGFNTKDKVFFYKNPAKNQALCCCTAQTLDKARRAHGTDQDIVFIYSNDRSHSDLAPPPISSSAGCHFDPDLLTIDSSAAIDLNKLGVELRHDGS